MAFPPTKLDIRPGLPHTALMKRIGILGGTFDPIHLGHLVPAQYACDFLRLDSLLLVPSASPVHRPQHHPASAEHRVNMCGLAATALPRFEVSEIETARPEPSYTALTLRSLRDALDPRVELVLLVGEDNLPLLHTWWHVKDILSLATIAVLPRPTPCPPDLGPLRAMLGGSAVDAIIARRVPGPLVPISATHVRSRLLAGLSIAGLVPRSVADYIAAHRLYAPCSPDSTTTTQSS
ncbi:MAG: nicotinate (nicotinamide) nucleotide adenylyltransferase [Planctomycetota bacterium]|nr:nicotinate (nicotinamide) nucleotide adenylyltransferase [Planctomycetota bacterium]